MKITVEINDQTLHAAIEAQLGQTVAKITDELITRKVNEIVDLKLSRLTDVRVQEVLQNAADKLVVGVLSSNNWQRESQVKAIIGEQAAKMVKEALGKG